MLRQKKEVWLLWDEVHGRAGTFVDTHDAETNDTDLDGVQVEFIPYVKINKSWTKTVQTLAGLGVSVRTDTVYPRDSVQNIQMPNPKTGVPRTYVVLEEDEHGNAPWAERRGRVHDRSVKELSRRVTQLEKQLNLQKMDNMQLEDEGRQPGFKRSGGRSDSVGGNEENSDVKSIQDMF
jgi:hypothetical protein